MRADSASLGLPTFSPRTCHLDFKLLSTTSVLLFDVFLFYKHRGDCTCPPLKRLAMRKDITENSTRAWMLDCSPRPQRTARHSRAPPSQPYIRLQVPRPEHHGTTKFSERLLDVTLEDIPMAFEHRNACMNCACIVCGANQHPAQLSAM